MTKLMAIAVAASVLSCAACRDDSVTAPPANGGGGVGSSVPRGAIVANSYCTPCHGTTLQGDTASGGATPSLALAGQYTSAEFDVLLIAGLTHDGRYVRDTMTSTSITGISAADRHALYDYLVNSWTP